MDRSESLYLADQNSQRVSIGNSTYRLVTIEWVKSGCLTKQDGLPLYEIERAVAVGSAHYRA